MPYTPEVAAPLVVLLGPTAVGKTRLAIDLAERMDGEIVSADSRLFYRGMDIGTAKPTLRERERVPHHLVDVADPDEIWGLARFQGAAYQALSGITARKRLPILVGGTGQYLRAVVEGWTIPAQPPDPRLRQTLQRWGNKIGVEALHARLRSLDPEAAGRIDPRNVRRTIRALEVILRTGERFSAQQGRREPGYRTLQLGLTRPRPELYGRIDRRIDSMLEAGLENEVRSLLDQGYPPDLPTFSAIGYREIVSVLKGDYSLEQAVILMRRRTRQFVRRQANWFKEEDERIRWFRAGPDVLEPLIETVQAFLATLGREAQDEPRPAV
jgi:tRNA dimethylallyltransferase